MHHVLGRRLLAGAAAVAATCALAASAHAVATPALDMLLGDMTVTNIATHQESYLVKPVVTAAGKVHVANARYTYELSGLDRVVLSDDFSPTRGAPEQPCIVSSPT